MSVNMERYRVLLSSWVDGEKISKQEEKALIKALRQHAQLRDYWFNLQTIRSILRGDGLMPDFTQFLKTPWKEYEYIALNLKPSPKKAKKRS
ncbi:MAG TPA: RseA family anti-sigma factor [Gammaproteobacteria bacterium]|nr:RseA family anti-sigma factor [Gammaproteobacteria bacterium]